jgi:hypothetical protein
MGSWGMVAVAMAAMCWLTPVQAGEGEKPKTEAAPGAIKATLEGKNFCVGCALKSKQGAGAQCSALGHKHAFKVIRVVGADGREMADMGGWVLHYLDTDKTQELLTKHHGEKLTITGIIYPEERVLEVNAFEKMAPPPKG